MEACTVMPAYSNMTNCMDICASFMLGLNDTAAEATNATVGCRTYHASVANSTTDALMKADHCWHAGPSGGKQCGTPCRAYCDMMKQSCNAAANNPFSDDAFCLSACSLYDIAGNASTVSGANLWCKIYHVTASFGGDKSHCTHASPSGAGLCGNRTENYCMIVNQTCTGTNALYTSMTSCMDFFNHLTTDGAVSDRGGDTRDCRIYHGIAAKALNDVSHCQHASHSGGNVCGTWCDVYCNLAISACGNNGTNMLYADPASCKTACAGIATAGKIGDANGDSIQCRIYHLGVASQSPANAVIHCPHAKVVSKDNTCGPAAAPTTTVGPSKTATGNAYAIVLSTLTLVGVLLF